MIYLHVPVVETVGFVTPFIVTSAVNVYVLPLVTAFVEEKSTYPSPESLQVARHEFSFHNFTTMEILSLVELDETKTEQFAVVPSKLIFGLIVLLRSDIACAVSGTEQISITLKHKQKIFFTNLIT